jgi:hypothetical protein
MIGLLFEEINWKSILCSIIVIVLIFGVGYLYQHNTASGRRELTDYRSEFQNGLERTLTVYTADGTILKQYEGKFDIANEDGYVKFDWDGKRYIYYNCYVETIADLP